MKQPSHFRSAIVLIIILVILFIANLLTGTTHIGWGNLWRILGGEQRDIAQIFWFFRMPKALTCTLAGGALATAGLMMQTLFRNPLAGPDVLGLSSGASLMVALIVLLGNSALGFLINNEWGLAIGASVGGGIILLFILAFAHYLRDNVSLLIVGLMISALVSSLVSVMQYVSRAEDLQSFLIWTLGNVGSTSYRELMVLFVIVLIGLIISMASLKSLNTWLLGDNYARSLGVNLKRSRLWIVVSTGLLTGSVTAFCGPIAFVGLAVPHLVRLILPATNHKILIPAVFGGGACLLLLCDLIAQLPGSTQVLPLNAVTSMIGAPVVIWLIVRMKRIHV
jgi:iron complex transport system permease protein